MTHQNIDPEFQYLPSIDDLKSIPTKELKRLFSRLNQSPPPPCSSRGIYRDNIAWMLQVIESGNDPIDLRQDLLKLASKVSISPKTEYLAGTRLIREWHGVTHEVVIEKDGYRWKNQHYRSLSKIAEAITGTHWSGPRFFGLKDSVTSLNQTNRGQL